ncbi:MAG TPA: cell division protein FtsA [Nitrospiria bacterium]|nr:cell division protein FtsA [Nitrospiria bacterium]
MAKRESIIVGLDIGTTKISVIVAEIKNEKTMDIIGIGTSPSRGLRKGSVINIESTVESIKRAVEEAELMAGVEIDAVYTGIAGSHIKGFDSKGVIAVKDKEVSRLDIERVVENAKAVNIPLDREILHVIPKEFILDGQDGIRDPLGISGVRLETVIHIITGAVTSTQNIVKCANRAGLQVIDIILQPLASSEAVLTQDELELGVVMIDIGGGTTDIAIFAEGCILHTAVLGIGGNHLTNDIAVGLRTPASDAEKIKKRYGCALTSLVKDDETIEVPSVGGRPPRILSRQLLSEIIEPRGEEIFSLVSRELKKTGYEEMIASGVVITGGTANMDGMVELAEKTLDLPVRRGSPSNIGGLVDIVSNPIFATGVGLTLYAFSKGRKRDLPNGTLLSKIVNIVKVWIKEFF